MSNWSPEYNTAYSEEVYTLTFVFKKYIKIPLTSGQWYVDWLRHRHREARVYFVLHLPASVHDDGHAHGIRPLHVQETSETWLLQSSQATIQTTETDRQ